jgi:EAL domain-containing protein (putative c-di-GMP-specific phosphodiesterase class I)
MDQGKPLMTSDSPLVDFDAVCQKVRAAVEPARTHAVSLHDELGDVLWLSESSMGPDEHNAVREAAEAFANPNAAPLLTFDLGDSRSAVMIRAVSGRRAMVGVVMIIMDSRIVALGAPKLMTPKMQRALIEFARMRPDREPELASLETELTLSLPTSAPSSPAPANRPAAPRTAAAPPATARAAPAPRVEAAPAARSAAPAQPPSAPSPTLMPFTAGPRSISAQVQQIVSRTPARPASPARPVRTARAESAVSPPIPAATRSAASPATPAASRSPAIPTTPAAARSPASPATPATAGNPRTATAPPLTISVQDADRQQSRDGVTPEIDRLHAALRKSPIALHVQRLIPLSKGSQLRRYEVLLRSGSEAAPNAAPHAMLKAAVENGLGSMIDRRVLSELISWLIRHPETCQADEVMFSVNLTSTALHDEHFIKFVELCLTKSSLPKATIAFEIDASTALTMVDKINNVAAALQRLGCPLVLDDFALRTECFELLRLPGVRYVKLAPQMTSKMRTDKVAQASITGVVQMARVLGMHTVAKRTETAAEQEWLTALGVDFVQSNSISPPVAIDSLNKAANFKI